MSRNWEATQNRHLQLFVCEKENHDNVICEVLTHSGDDAKLLAAAPDLYEAVEELTAAMKRYEMDVCEVAPIAHRKMMHKAEKALAKARGET